MPDGRTHTTASLIAAPITGAAALFIVDPLQAATVAIGVYAGILIGPDLDVDGGNYSLAVIRRTPLVGPALAALWRVFWWPYSKLAAHRGFSHWPLIGTLGRLLYIAIAIFIPVAIFNAGITLPARIEKLAPFFVAGIAISDLLHIFMDGFWKNHKNLKNGI